MSSHGKPGWNSSSIPISLYPERKKIEKQWKSKKENNKTTSKTGKIRYKRNMKATLKSFEQNPSIFESKCMKGIVV